MKHYILTVANERGSRKFRIDTNNEFFDCTTDLFDTIEDYMEFCDAHDISDDDKHFVEEATLVALPQNIYDTIKQTDAKIVEWNKYLMEHQNDENLFSKCDELWHTIDVDIHVWNEHYIYVCDWGFHDVLDLLSIDTDSIKNEDVVDMLYVPSEVLHLNVSEILVVREE